jgi:hypothetical protein
MECLRLAWKQKFEKKKEKHVAWNQFFFEFFFFSQSGDHPEEDLTNPG